MPSRSLFSRNCRGNEEHHQRVSSVEQQRSLEEQERAERQDSSSSSKRCGVMVEVATQKSSRPLRVVMPRRCLSREAAAAAERVPDFVHLLLLLLLVLV